MWGTPGRRRRKRGVGRDVCRDATLSLGRSLHPHHRVVFRRRRPRIFIQEDLAGAAVGAPRTDDRGPGSADTFYGHDRMHHGQVRLIHGHIPSVEGDRVPFGDRRQAERRFVATVEDLAAAAATGVLEDGELLVVLLHANRREIPEE